MSSIWEALGATLEAKGGRIHRIDFADAQTIELPQELKSEKIGQERSREKALLLSLQAVHLGGQPEFVPGLEPEDPQLWIVPDDAGVWVVEGLGTPADTHAQSVAAAGRVARGIAHEMNNVLHLQLGAVQCLERIALPEESTRWIETLGRAITRGRNYIDLVHPILRVAQNDEREPATVLTLQDVIDDTVRAIAPCSGIASIGAIGTVSGEVFAPRSTLLWGLSGLLDDLLAHQSPSAIELASQRVAAGATTRARLDITVSKHRSAPQENRAATRARLRLIRAELAPHDITLVPLTAGFRLEFPVRDSVARTLSDSLGILVSDNDASAIIAQLDQAGASILASGSAAALDLFQDYEDELEFVLIDARQPSPKLLKTLTQILTRRQKAPTVLFVESIETAPNGSWATDEIRQQLEDGRVVVTDANELITVIAQATLDK